MRSPRDEVSHDEWGDVRSRIHLDPTRFEVDALRGLEAFSHLEVVFVFDRIPVDRIEVGSLHPRGRVELPKVGIFATRQKERTNRLGVSRCRLLAIEELVLHVADLDVLDGTPVVDVKPWVARLGPRGPVREPRWITELMADYYEPR
ncbi:SAM-dependent methyltransferase [Paraliomyxa miuraensis]|uniref:SAM-dependent methyltransferase n=1 Tax=Paraliomyxa miuraensis TaxID=376150 RepID=UPI002253A7EC|nr:SAM-dependent methyltransferase [Paraliomyxa miuraensis]MCX4242436.1 SAM-dependent methyltransferase [Paraliomyxa miuraensis]